VVVKDKAMMSAQLARTEPPVPEGPTQDFELLTPAEAAERLGVSECTLWRWRKQGLIRARKQGRWIRFTPEDIRDFVEKSAERKRKGA
jgi:excisionase family DNA binding protein